MKPSSTFRIIGLGLLAGAFNLLVFPYFSMMMGGHQLLDTRFFYNPQSVAGLLSDLGEDGRRWYLWMSGLADMLYPLFYGRLFLELARLATPRKSLHKMAWLAPLADVAENMFTFSMLLVFPSFIPALAYLGSFFNGTKWLAVGLFLSWLLFAAVAKIIRRLDPKRHDANY
ncbi:MAG: hypothetical protein IPM52_03690 [Bacteroidetes bacterium]|nr:hypothetical protein [Bacteroidota bacterium]